MWKHIAQRQPVVIRGVDGAWEAFTDDWLVQEAGNATVMVERRSSAKGSYGQGVKAPMKLRQLIHELQQGNTGLYMSTQEVGVGRDGHPLLYGAPLVQLEGRFPLLQPLMGNLVPQSVNMWMGCAPEGSSTGLHHDFHDNLYVLLRGCKRFRLYPPDAAPDMYVRGKLQRIYHNGRIVYEGQGDVLPDGSDKHDVHLWQARHNADEAAAAAADDALEVQLELMLQEGAEGFEEGLEGLADDYIDSDDDGPADLYSDDEDDQASDDADCDDQQQAGKRKGLAGKQQRQQQPDKKRQKQATAGPAAAHAAGPASVEPPPPSFSQVDLSLPEAVLRRQFPRFPGVAAAQEVLLQAGQMLYLPAGWFHEVTSYGGGGLDGGHLAINYWYHPPDNLDSSKAGFKQPYSSAYYPSLWAQRQPWLQQATQRWWQHKQQHMQQQGAAADAADTDGGMPHHQLRVKTHPDGQRHVAWREEVHSPSNKYRMSMTKDGTATGDAGKMPDGSQPDNGPCCGTIGCLEPDTGSESDSPCSSRDAPAPAASGKAGKQQRQQQQQQQQKVSKVQQATQHADECTLRHAAAAAGANAPADKSDHDEGAKAANGNAAAAAGDDEDEGLKSLSEEVRAGIAAIEDYFTDNPEAADRLLEEFMAQRQQRLAAAAAAKRGAGQVLALPRLYGRRHHHFATVKLVKRRPGLR
uniref:JmjC domain-containing protein n=1 Tax=Tetradesmus obliquus TaxID=3088 RepID=A0A383WCI6_TETOB|eukprot:jgi/Sobl393_1/163/SZX74902.1